MRFQRLTIRSYEEIIVSSHPSVRQLGKVGASIVIERDQLAIAMTKRSADRSSSRSVMC